MISQLSPTVSLAQPPRAALDVPSSFLTCAGFTSSSDTQCSIHSLNTAQAAFEIRCPWDIKKQPSQELYHSWLFLCIL